MRCGPYFSRAMRAAFALVALPIGFAISTPKRIVILGDSITDGLGVTRAESYPTLLQSLLAQNGHPEVAIINAGVSGSTTSSGLSRLRWQLHTKPDLLILELGANDMLRGQPAALAQKNLADMIALAQAAQVKVLLTGMRVPPNYGTAYEKNFDRIYADLAATYHVPLVPFILEGVAGDPALNQSDGIHPNARGHQKIARLLLPYVLKSL